MAALLSAPVDCFNVLLETPLQLEPEQIPALDLIRRLETGG